MNGIIYCSRELKYIYMFEVILNVEIRGVWIEVDDWKEIEVEKESWNQCGIV